MVQTHSVSAVHVIVVIEVAGLILAAKSLQLSPKSGSQQTVVVGEVNQRVVIQLVTGQPISHRNALHHKHRYHNKVTDVTTEI